METYNGYSNKPTWALALWIQNDEGLSRYWNDKARELPEYELSQELKSYFEDEVNPLTERATLYSDLLDYSLGLIDWIEIAQVVKTLND